MAQEPIMPKRPVNDVQFISIKANDRDCLSYSVAFNAPNERAFALFHPEFLDEQGKLTKVGKTQCRQFFSYARNKEYADAYRKTLESFFDKGHTVADNIAGDIDDSRKDKVLKQLLGQAMSLVEGGEGLDPDTMKTVVEVFRKLNILKDDVVEQEAPRRYIPVRCRQECQYRVFCEKAIENGEIENECMYCKALAVAKEHGYKYDPATNLNIPQEDVK